MRFDDSDFVIKKDSFNQEYILCSYHGNESIVEIPDGVTSVGPFVFADEDHPNDTIAKIVFPDTVTQIDSQAFCHCRKLEEIQWPDNEDFKILKCFFDGCDSFAELTLPKSMDSVPVIKLPPNIKKIKLHSDIKCATQNSFVTSFEDNGLAKNDLTIRIFLSNSNYRIIDGFMVNVKHRIALFHVDRTKKTVRVPDGILELGVSCFNEYDYFEFGERINEYTKKTIVPVENVVIPKSVRVIHAGAFLYCKNLKSVIYKGKASDLETAENIFCECGDFSDLDAKVACVDTADKGVSISNMKLERFLYIHKRFKSGARLNKNDLIKEMKERFGLKVLGVATVTRDLDLLRDRFNAPIKYDHTEKAYYYTDLNFSIES